MWKSLTSEKCNKEPNWLLQITKINKMDIQSDWAVKLSCESQRHDGWTEYQCCTCKSSSGLLVAKAFQPAIMSFVKWDDFQRSHKLESVKLLNSLWIQSKTSFVISPEEKQTNNHQVIYLFTGKNFNIQIFKELVKLMATMWGRWSGVRESHKKTVCPSTQVKRLRWPTNH